MTTPNVVPFTTRLAAERAEWEAANPSIAYSWNQALAEKAEREAAAREARAASELATRTQRACRAVGMPTRALEALGEPRQTLAMETLEKNAKALESGMVLLAGPPGTGKTVACVHAAAAAMASAMKANPERVAEMPDRVAIFVRAVTLARCSAYGADAANAMGRYCSTRLLVIDDLGAETKSPIWEMLLFEILDTRHGDMKPTLITSNLGRDKFVESYGIRLAERIREGGAAVFLNGESMRGQS